MPKAPQLVVREHVPWKRNAVIAAVIVAVLLFAYLFYQYGQSSAGHNFESLYNERDELRATIDRLEKELGEQRDLAVALQRSSEIDTQAYKEVDESLRALQSEILELKEEVAFYRSIVAPGESAKGLRIQSFKLEANREAQSYKYKLVLTQVIKHGRITRGKIELSIEGLQNGEQRTLMLREVDSGKQDELSFKFKYFQNFEGDMVLPEGFLPSRVLLKITSNVATIEKTFDWPFDGPGNNPVQTSGVLQESL